MVRVWIFQIVRNCRKKILQSRINRAGLYLVKYLTHSILLSYTWVKYASTAHKYMGAWKNTLKSGLLLETGAVTPILIVIFFNNNKIFNIHGLRLYKLCYLGLIGSFFAKDIVKSIFIYHSGCQLEYHHTKVRKHTRLYYTSFLSGIP